MNTQAIQKKLDEYMETATPEQIVKEFEDLGVEFVNTNDMNLIQQLQQTSKWKEFDAWYTEQQYCLPLRFIELPLEFTKGVFEKFIESRGVNIEKQLKDLSYEQKINLSENEMLNKRYNEEWFIKTVLIINGNYKTAFLPVDQQIPFGSFEELLIWYFNN